MKEQGFSLYDRQDKIRIAGGNLWKAQKRTINSGLLVTAKKEKAIKLYLIPNDSPKDLRNYLYELVFTICITCIDHCICICLFHSLGRFSH